MSGTNEQVKEQCSTGLIQAATRIYDAVYWFCETFLNARSIMADQMLRAARSGRRDLFRVFAGREVSVAMQRRYMHLASAQYDGLMLDCGDYLRHRRLMQWDDQSPEAAEIEALLSDLAGTPSGGGEGSVLSDEGAWNRFSLWLEHEEPAVRMNAVICMIRHLQLQMERVPWLTEADRTQERGRDAARQEPAPTGGGHPEPQAASSPDCPQCGRPMVRRTAKTGKAAGRSFWGCSGYPDCKAIVNA